MTNATLKAEASAKCSGNIQCEFDFIFTGNEQLALQTENTELAGEARVEEASKDRCQL